MSAIGQALGPGLALVSTFSSDDPAVGAVHTDAMAKAMTRGGAIVRDRQLRTGITVPCLIQGEDQLSAGAAASLGRPSHAGGRTVTGRSAGSLATRMKEVYENLPLPLPTVAALATPKLITRKGFRVNLVTRGGRQPGSPALVVVVALAF